mmetsp:Transcript_39688/g.99948  ORF Transcript_39688/g.99948 Transcript_39688/m.99948 type:complete len:293 (+) Transcript_39688:791-1669(+)
MVAYSFQAGKRFWMRSNIATSRPHCLFSSSESGVAWIMRSQMVRSCSSAIIPSALSRSAPVPSASSSSATAEETPSRVCSAKAEEEEGAAAAAAEVEAAAATRSLYWMRVRLKLMRVRKISSRARVSSITCSREAAAEEPVRTRSSIGDELTSGLVPALRSGSSLRARTTSACVKRRGRAVIGEESCEAAVVCLPLPCWDRGDPDDGDEESVGCVGSMTRSPGEEMTRLSSGRRAERARWMSGRRLCVLRRGRGGVAASEAIECSGRVEITDCRRRTRSSCVTGLPYEEATI